MTPEEIKGLGDGDKVRLVLGSLTRECIVYQGRVVARVGDVWSDEGRVVDMIPENWEILSKVKHLKPQYFKVKDSPPNLDVERILDMAQKRRHLILEIMEDSNKWIARIEALYK